MPTITLVDDEKPGVQQIKRYTMMVIKRAGGSIDRAQLLAHLNSIQMFRPAIVLQALQELQSEGRITQQ